MAKRLTRTLSGLVALLLAAPAATAQQSAVDDYFAAFERARATLIRESDKYPHQPWTKEQRNELDALHNRLSSDLEVAMRRIVGPVVAPKGFTGDGAWNGEVWTGLGADRLHGIAFRVHRTDHDWSELLVTTDEIMVKWLAKYILPDNPQLRGDLDASFARGALSASIIDDDGWLASFASLAVDKPKGVDALTAFVGEGGNGDLIWPPQLLSIYLRKGHRIYLADTTLAIKFSPIAACDPGKELVEMNGVPVWKGGNEALDRYNKCWEERGKDNRGIAAAAWQAQAFIDALADL